MADYFKGPGVTVIVYNVTWWEYTGRPLMGTFGTKEEAIEKIKAHSESDRELDLGNGISIVPYGRGPTDKEYSEPYLIEEYEVTVPI